MKQDKIPIKPAYDFLQSCCHQGTKASTLPSIVPFPSHRLSKKIKHALDRSNEPVPWWRSPCADMANPSVASSQSGMASPSAAAVSLRRGGGRTHW